MRLLVCGGRTYTGRKALYDELGKYNIECIIHGGANGADKLASDFCVIFSIPEFVFRPDWERYGKAAGPKRNEQMILIGKPDRVIACPGGAGTSSMTFLAAEHGIPIKCI